MRQLIAAMKLSMDDKFVGPEGYADGVEAWSDDYGLTSQIDACLLGGRMYPGYEQYWTAIRDGAPDAPLPMTNKLPTAAEQQWERFAADTPHYVLTNTLNSAQWQNTRFLREPAEVSALKQQSGEAIYLMGGAEITASLIDAGLVDELRLIVYPLIAGQGKSLFDAANARHTLQLRNMQQLGGGRISLTYAVL